MRRYIIQMLCLMCYMLAVQAVCAKDFTVVIDAGHGGHDPGAIGKTSKEKNINLNVALKLGKLIQQNCPDVKVIYTRKTDVFIPLDRRAEIANNAKADLFISVHTNSLAKNNTTQGSSTWTLGLAKSEANLDVAKRENSVILYEDDYKTHYAGFNPNSAESYIIFEFMQDKYMSESVRLAQLVQQQFRTTCKRQDHGVHQAGFLVLKASAMPSILVELGFISTPAEERFLNSDSGSSSLANGIFRAFLTYKREKEISLKGSSKTMKPEEVPTVEPQPDPAETTVVEKKNQKKGQQQDNRKANTGTGLEDNIIVDENFVEPPQQQTATGKQQNVSERTDRQPQEASDGETVFAVQFLTADRKLSSGDKRFKGLTDVDFYRDRTTYKYIYGKSADYNQTLKAFRVVRAKFTDAFIIALKNGERVDVNQAIKEFKSKK